MVFSEVSTAVQTNEQGLEYIIYGDGLVLVPAVAPITSSVVESLGAEFASQSSTKTEILDYETLFYEPVEPQGLMSF